MHRVVRKHVSAQCRFLNLYGCTEAAGDSTCFEISPDFVLKDYHPPTSAIRESLPLGHPISQSCVFLLEPTTEQRHETLNVDFGESSEPRDERKGEICVGGCGLFYESGQSPSSHSASAFVEWSAEILQTAMEEGNGIWSDDWRPAESKVTLFRTGDLGCIDSTGLRDISYIQSSLEMLLGLLWFCGRLDHRVKLSGKFVHLLEIERSLKKLKSVADAVAVSRHPDLVIYIIASDDLKQESTSSLLSTFSIYLVQMKHL